jgi:hypothetical protein
VRPQQGWPQEQRVKVQPYVAMVAGAQVEVSLPGTGKLVRLGFHRHMVA